jgi:hypothetical protein
MKTPDPSDRQQNTGDDAVRQDDIAAEWLFDSSAGFEPMLFDTSAQIEAVYFDTSANAVVGANDNRAPGGGAAVPGWEAYRRHGYSIWRYDGAGWQVVASRCTAGAVCGAPPREAGQYVGEHRKKNCEPAVAELPPPQDLGIAS